MPQEIVQVEGQRVTLALRRFSLSLRQRDELLKGIAAGMLVSLRRTFREQGSPSGSWAPLAPATLRSAKSKASAGRKILILSGKLLNSIQSQATPGGIVIGTNLPYARVQQEGSADRAGAAIGPQARIAGRGASVGKHSRIFLREIHYGLRSVTGRDGKQHMVPAAERTGEHRVSDKNGRSRNVKAAYQGPRLQQNVQVSAHTAFQNIPPRPYLVFRPDDEPRIRGQVLEFIQRAEQQAGLAQGGA